MLHEYAQTIYAFLHGINFYLVGTSLLYFFGAVGAGIATGFAVVRLMEAIGVTDWIASQFTETEEPVLRNEVSQKLMKKYARISGTRPEELKLQAVVLQLYALLDAEYGEAIANGQPAPSLEDAIATLAHQR
jgi:F0F1-type ATP synthase membrane subunit c/vacuolar-type H+-ATPase subunit K